MNRKYKLFIFIIIAITFVGLASFEMGFLPLGLSKAKDISIGTNIGQQAPDFTLTKLDGEKLTLSELRGKKVFLNFWASWCPPCKSEMPDIQKLYTEHDDVAVIGVNIKENKGQVAEFMMTNGYYFNVVLDTEGKTAMDYLVRGIPTTYILDEQGIITAKHTGPLTYNQMLTLLEIN